MVTLRQDPAAGEARGNGCKAIMETKETMDKSGLYLGNVSDAEAKEFHNAFMSGFYIWLLVAIVAHILVWMWKPWLTVDAKRASLESLVTLSNLLA